MLSNGGSTFAEDPRRDAVGARLIWAAALDPEILVARAIPAGAASPDRFDPRRFKGIFTLAVDPSGREHAVFSDGFRHIRLDLAEGSLASGDPVLLQYSLSGLVGAATESRLMPLRRLVGLCRTGRFLPALFPRDPRAARLIEALRVHDALAAGASQRDIAAHFFGSERVPGDWRVASDSLRSRVRRLIREARRMAGGGYRILLGKAQAK